MMRRWPPTLFLLLSIVAGLIADPCRAQPGSGDPWIEVQTEHFTLLSNAGQRTTVQIGTRLEQLWQVMAATFADIASRPPTWIYVFRDEAAISPFKMRADGRPDTVAGYYVATPLANYIAIDASAGEGPFRAVYHEFVHYFLHNNLPYAPLWLNEGLAEYYSTVRIRGARADLGLPIDDHRQWLLEHDPIPLARLFLIDTDSPEYREGLGRGTFYAQSWALTHYLMSHPDKKRMNALMQEFRRGATAESALSLVYGLDLPTLEPELKVYASGRTLPSQEWRFGDWEAGPVVTQILERGEVRFRLGDLLTHRVPIQFAAAEEYLQAALAADSTRAAVYASLGQLRHEAGRYPESHAFNARAVELAPDDAGLRLGFGLSLLEEYFAPETGQPLTAPETPPLLFEAREHLRGSMALAHPGVEDDLAFGRTFLLDRGPVPEGISALIRVVDREPWRLDAVRDLIALKAHSGDRSGARSLLDTSLRPRATPELLRQAEMILAAEDLLAAKALADQERVDEAKTLLVQTMSETQDGQVRIRVAEYLAELERGSTSSSAGE
jgi:hypothetical protein